MNRALHSSRALLPLALLAGVAAAPGAAAQGAPLFTLASPLEQQTGLFGSSVAMASDLDGDGRPDLIVGAFAEEVPGNSQLEGGRAHVFSGATGAPLHTFASPNEEDESYFGGPYQGVADVGDVDGDGRPDFLIGAEEETPEPQGHGTSWAGRAYVFAGGTGALLHILESPNVQRSGYFGRSVSGAGDVNSDGRGDLLVGAYKEDDGSEGGPLWQHGRAYVLSGATGALLHTLESPNPSYQGNFGQSVSSSGDVDGDGTPDVLVGAHQERVGDLYGAGRAYVFSGASGALLHTFESPAPEGDSLDVPDPQLFGRFGFSVAGVGDADGDGRPDLLVGAPEETLETSPYGADGRAYLFSGATGALLRTLVSPTAFSPYGRRFGNAVSGAGDVDGDGRADLLVGASAEPVVVGSQELVAAGRAFVFSGATGELLRTLTSPNPESYGRFGHAVSGGADVDGDGRPDFLIGTYGESPGAAPGAAGRAYLFSGVGPVAGEPDPAPAPLALDVAPNPARGSVWLVYTLGRSGSVRLAVYDALGREVAVLTEGARAAGLHEVALDGPALPPGLYLVRLHVAYPAREAGAHVLTRRLTLVR